MKKLLIGGQALVQLGSSRSTNDTDYLIFYKSSNQPFLVDEVNNIDYINANGGDFFHECWKAEKGNDTGIASPQTLLELKAYAFVQHCQNRFFQKADDCEYDMKFLVRKFNLTAIPIAAKYMGEGEYSECMKVIHSTKK